MILPILAQIRRVARSGDTVRAWAMFGTAGLLQSNDTEALTLKGRLLKDQALRSEGAEPPLAATLQGRVPPLSSVPSHHHSP